LRCDPRAVWAAVRDAVATMSPGDVDDLDGGVAQLETVLGISLEDDVLAHLGDVLSLWSAPSEGGLLFTGATAALSLRDGKAFGAVFDKVMERIIAMSKKRQRDERGRFRRGFYLQSLEHRGTTIYYVNMVGDDMPIAPAWCATDTHLMFGLFPQMLKSNIDRGCVIATSLASRTMAIDPPPAVALSYVDAASAVETVYPLLLPLANLAAAELQRDGFDIDIGALPTQASVARHLRAEHGALQWADGGLLFTRQGTLPFGDPVLGMLLPTAGLWTAMYRFEVAAVEAERRARRELERRRRDK